MRRATIVLSLLLGVLAFTMRADSASEPDLAGYYLCSGKNFDGSSYDGVVEITKDNGTFQLQWLIDDDVVAVGMGIRQGDVLAVAYYSALPGVVAYRIEPNNKLVGEWTLVGAKGALFSETLTKVAADKIPSRTPKPTTPRPPSGRQRRGQLKAI